MSKGKKERQRETNKQTLHYREHTDGYWTGSGGGWEK